MHIAVCGAGALGSVYGVRLARRTHASVTFVVRDERLRSERARRPLVIERVKETRDRRDELAAPSYASAVPSDADVVLLAVGTEDLEGIRPVLDGSRAPIVVLTPMLLAGYTRMRAAFGERVLAGMPAIVAYAHEDRVVRYWVPPTLTRIDEPRAGSQGDVIRALAARLGAAGLRAHLELGVHESNPATTVCVIPEPAAGDATRLARRGGRDASLLPRGARLRRRALREEAARPARRDGPRDGGPGAHEAPSPRRHRRAAARLG